MQTSQLWINPAIWILAVINWGICLVLAREIASEKGYPPYKSWLLGLLGPIGLLWAWRFPPNLRDHTEGVSGASSNDEADLDF